MRDGYFLVEDAVAPSLVESLRSEVFAALAREPKHDRNDIDFGRILFCPVYGGSFFEVLAHERLMQPFDHLLDPASILYTMTTSCIPPQGGNYTSQVHNDCKINVSNYLVKVIVLLMLDDFTPENGATQLLPGSHTTPSCPDEDTFVQGQKTIVGKAGTALFFDPRVWHRSGFNQSTNWRSCLLMAMVRPWMKQRFDVANMLKEQDLSNLSPVVQRRLGLQHLPPGSAAEYYSRQSK